MASWVRKLFGGIHGPRYVDGEDRHQQSLLDLPHELLLQIIDFLYVSDMACLSLCNRALRNKLCIASWESLCVGNGFDEQGRDFPLRLTRDHPSCFSAIPVHTCILWIESGHHVRSSKGGAYGVCAK